MSVPNNTSDFPDLLSLTLNSEAHASNTNNSIPQVSSFNNRNGAQMFAADAANGARQLATYDVEYLQSHNLNRDYFAPHFSNTDLEEGKVHLRF